MYVCVCVCVFVNIWHFAPHLHHLYQPQFTIRLHLLYNLTTVNVTVQFSLQKVTKARKGRRGTAPIFFLTSAQDGVGSQHHALAA